MHSANDQIIFLCLCAIVPLCLAPEKAKIAKQVPARCGHVVELHVAIDIKVPLCCYAFAPFVRKTVRISK